MILDEFMNDVCDNTFLLALVLVVLVLVLVLVLVSACGAYLLQGLHRHRQSLLGVGAAARGKVHALHDHGSSSN